MHFPIIFPLLNAACLPWAHDPHLYRSGDKPIRGGASAQIPSNTEQNWKQKNRETTNSCRKSLQRTFDTAQSLFSCIHLNVVKWRYLFQYEAGFEEWTDLGRVITTLVQLTVGLMDLEPCFGFWAPSRQKNQNKAVAQHMLVKSQKAVYTISSYLMPQLPLSLSATSSPLGFWEMFLSEWYPFLDSGRVAQCGRRKPISSYCGSAKQTWQTWQTCLWWKWCMKCDVRCETEVFRSHKSWTQNVFRIWTSELRIKDNLLRSFRFSWWSFTASFSTS